MRRGIVTPCLAAISAATLTATLAVFIPDEAWSAPEYTPASSASARRSCTSLTRFTRSRFTHSVLRSRSRFLPLIPGTQLVYDGKANNGGRTLPHRVIFTVTDMVKTVRGVRTRVIWDQDFYSGKLTESELAFHAQDRNGNVWVLGEYPEEYDERGHFTGAPSTWIAGQRYAQAGVLVPGRPGAASRSFLQGKALGIEFLDCGRVIATNQHVCVPAGCFDGVLVVDETSPLDGSNRHQRKYYAPGVGVIQVGEVDDPEGETLVLTAIRHLRGTAMTRVRSAVRRLERRAYRVSRVYRHTARTRLGG